jgi:hypothetical protein
LIRSALPGIRAAAEAENACKVYACDALAVAAGELGLSHYPLLDPSTEEFIQAALIQSHGPVYTLEWNDGFNGTQPWSAGTAEVETATFVEGPTYCSATGIRIKTASGGMKWDADTQALAPNVVGTPIPYSGAISVVMSNASFSAQRAFWSTGWSWRYHPNANATYDTLNYAYNLSIDGGNTIELNYSGTPGNTWTIPAGYMFDTDTPRLVQINSLVTPRMENTGSQNNGYTRYRLWLDFVVDIQIDDHKFTTWTWSDFRIDHWSLDSLGDPFADITNTSKDKDYFVSQALFNASGLTLGHTTEDNRNVLYQGYLQNFSTYVDPDPLCGVTVPTPNEDPVPERFALVWNFEDNNFTWMDASVIDAGELVPSVCMTYGLEPGWQTTWASLLDHGIIWGAEGDTGLDNLMAGTDEWGDGESPTGWDDFYYAGKEQGMFWLSDAGVSEADQVLDKSGLKQYFAERVSMDFDDALGSTSNTYKHVRQLFPLLESPESGAMNTYRFSIGWSANLMDEPDYKPGRTIYLNKSGYSGKHKIDTRSTGRYMAMKWDFTYTDEIAMTGVDIDIEESHGR